MCKIRLGRENHFCSKKCNDTHWTKRARGQWCLSCKKSFDQKGSEQKFCSHSCSALFNNKRRGLDKSCPVCLKNIGKIKRVCCSVSCRMIYYENQIAHDWVSGRKICAGEHSVSPKIKEFLRKTSMDTCFKCGWNQIHPILKKVPLQVNHIDGNPLNHSVQNLELVCPNCHSLTSSFGALNRGNGRSYRRKKSPK